MSDKYDKMADEVQREIDCDSCCNPLNPVNAIIAAFGRKCAAQAYEDAADWIYVHHHRGKPDLSEDFKYKAAVLDSGGPILNPITPIKHTGDCHCPDCWDGAPPNGAKEIEAADDPEFSHLGKARIVLPPK